MENLQKDTAHNMGFARCGVEGNLREILESTRKKPFRFYFFVNLKKRKWFSLAFGSLLEISVAVARTSQSPFPLAAIHQRYRKTYSNYIIKLKN